MSADNALIAVGGAECHEFSEREIVVDDESFSEIEPIVAYGKFFQPSELLRLHVEGVMVVAESVSVGKKGFSCVLRTDDGCLELLLVLESVANGVSVGWAEIDFVVAASFVERNPACGQQFVSSSLQNFRQTKFFLLCVAEINEAKQQLARGFVEAFNHGQLSFGKNGSVAIDEL